MEIAVNWEMLDENEIILQKVGYIIVALHEEKRKSILVKESDLLALFSEKDYHQEVINRKKWEDKLFSILMVIKKYSIDYRFTENGIRFFKDGHYPYKVKSSLNGKK